jgi:hypothetical protein
MISIDIESLVNAADRMATPDAVGALLGVNLSLPAWEVLRGSQRVVARLSALANGRLGPARQDELEPADRAIVIAGWDVWTSIAAAAGAIAYSRQIRLTVAGRDVSSLIEKIGAEAHRCGMIVGDDTPTIPLTTELPLAAAILDTGKKSFAAWVASLPPGFAHRIALLTPHLPTPPMIDPDLATLYRRASAMILDE